MRVFRLHLEYPVGELSVMWLDSETQTIISSSMFLAFSLYFPCLNLSYILGIDLFIFFFFSSFLSNGLHCQKEARQAKQKEELLRACRMACILMFVTWANPDTKAIRAPRSVMCHQCGQNWKVHSDLQKHQNFFRIQRRVVLMKTWKIISASTVQLFEW